MNTYANILKLQIECPVVFLLTSNLSSLGITKIIHWSYVVKGIIFSLVCSLVWHLHCVLLQF